MEYGKRITFSSTAERDEYIKVNFPERECGDTPGSYRVPGGCLSVFLETVTFYPEQETNERKQ